ncbi:unnamed protein product [Cochlearia groenlandica]
MTLSQSLSLSSLTIQFHKHNLAGESKTPRILISPTSKTPKNRLSISSSHTARSKPCSPLRIISSVAGDGTVESSSSSSVSSPISSIFVKGLSDTVSEGRLRKVFSEFGQVNNVKVIVNERTRQSLGYGYVWFSRIEDAELAVESMNGKFFEGRFILVKFGQPGLSSRRRSHSDVLFTK